jgi:hypothetical protein
VDDFRQEQTYFLGKEWLHNRWLHGYGTVWGLQVTIHHERQGTQVCVSAGSALNPRGQVIHVPEEQCACLDDWLKGHRDELHERFGPRPPRPLPLYVTLCYRELETDPVPLPREEERVPSRIAEGFELALHLDPPSQEEEMAVRRLGAELAAIKPISRPRTLDLDAARQAIADRVRWLRTPPELAPPPEPLPIEPGWQQAVLHTAFRVWVTEVRPALLEEQGPCVLLARLDLALAENWRLSREPAVVEDDRPLLLHTRLLQEPLPI